jgi:hypothetical protein
MKLGKISAWLSSAILEMMAVMPLYQVILKGATQLEFLTVDAESVTANDNYYKLDSAFFAREHTIGVVRVDSIRKEVDVDSDPVPRGTVKQPAGKVTR